MSKVQMDIHCSAKQVDQVVEIYCVMWSTQLKLYSVLRICSEAMVSAFITMKPQLVRPSKTRRMIMKSMFFFQRFFILLGVKLN